jgi:hypothetical protein
MKNVQTVLTDTEFLRLKTYCIVHRKSLKQIVQEAISDYLAQNDTKKEK